MGSKSVIFYCLASMALFCINTTFAQKSQQIDQKKLLKDLNYLEKVIEAHPDPYTHISEKEFKSKLAEVRTDLNRPHSLLEFYRTVASIVARIKDGHSSVHLPRFWLQTQRKQRGAFPYEVYLTNENELYITKNFDNSVIPVGSKITGINGISVDSFLNRIDPYISYELRNFRNTLIDEAFEQYVYVAFDFADITLDYVFADSSQIKVKYMPYKEWKKFQKDIREESDRKIAIGEPYAYKKAADGIGLINIYAFSASDFDAYNQFLAKTFKNIRQDNIHSLIIDVRGNFGGWPKIASRLFHYISESHFKTLGMSSMKVSNAYRNNLFRRYPGLREDKPYIPQRRHYVDLNEIILGEPGTYVDEDIFFNEKPETEKWEFNGDCYLLTNRDTYSAASNFASTFQCYQMGVIIGEETGGTKILRANAIYEELTRSGLIVAMSTTKMFATCFSQDLQGVKPEIQFTPSALDVRFGVDSQLNYTQRVIKQVRKKRLSER